MPYISTDCVCNSNNEQEYCGFVIIITISDYASRGKTLQYGACNSSHNRDILLSRAKNTRNGSFPCIFVYVNVTHIYFPMKRKRVADAFISEGLE